MPGREREGRERECVRVYGTVQEVRERERDGENVCVLEMVM